MADGWVRSEKAERDHREKPLANSESSDHILISQFPNQSNTMSIIASSQPAMKLEANAVYDDEYLIRVFVRIRRDVMMSEKRTEMEQALYHKVLRNTNYRLPGVHGVSSGSSADNLGRLKRVISDLSDADAAMEACASEANQAMNVTMRVIQPATIIYSDSKTGNPISYEEYEKRYRSYLDVSKLKDRIQRFIGMASAPIQGVFGSAKKQRLQEVI